MKTIAIAFAAAVMIGLTMPVQAAQNTNTGTACMQSEAGSAQAVADEVSSGRRKWKRHGWHGKRKWHGRGWHGHRKWRGHRWHGRRHWGWRGYRYWGGGSCFGNRGRCVGIWRHGRRVIVCCR